MVIMVRRPESQRMADEYPITWGELLDFQSRVVSCRQALGHGM